MYLASSGWKLIKNIIVERFGNTKIIGYRTFFDYLITFFEVINLMNMLIQYFVYGVWWEGSKDIITIKFFLPFCLMCIIGDQSTIPSSKPQQKFLQVNPLDVMLYLLIISDMKIYLLHHLYRKETHYLFYIHSYKFSFGCFTSWIPFSCTSKYEKVLW